MAITQNTLNLIIRQLNASERSSIEHIATKNNIPPSIIKSTLNWLITHNAPIKEIQNDYCLEYPLHLLNKPTILHALNEPINLSLYPSIHSTNDFLKKSHNQDSAIHACLAETQTQGRGQQAKPWHSPFGENIYLSIAIPFRQAIYKLSGISLAIGIAIGKAINKSQKSSLPIKIKWPNDLMIHQQKLAGVLIEIHKPSTGLPKLIIGIGLNVNMIDRAPIDQPWTSIRKVTGTPTNRNPLCAAIINETIAITHQFLNTGLKPFLEDWQPLDYLYNQPITLTTNKKTYQGTGAGINADGHLLIRTHNKKIIPIYSADGSIKITEHTTKTII